VGSVVSKWDAVGSWCQRYDTVGSVVSMCDTVGSVVSIVQHCGVIHVPSETLWFYCFLNSDTVGKIMSII